jgi:hypothetical protein
VQRNPDVQFPAPGVYQVTLTTCYNTICDSETKTVTVLDPQPVITSATAGPTLLSMPAAVDLAGTGKGKPPLDFTWRVLDDDGNQVALLHGANAIWKREAGALGRYRIYLDLSNDAGLVTSEAMVVELAEGIFSDGFELGDTLAWSSLVVPP